MKVMVFLHGTTISEEGGVDLPIRNAARKLQAWSSHGAEIVYLTHRRHSHDVEGEKLVLARHGFPEGPIYYRQGGEGYADVAERVLPDVIVEDDCASIGGEKEMTYPHIRPRVKARIVSVVVKEGGGVDHLPEDPEQLKSF